MKKLPTEESCLLSIGMTISERKCLFLSDVFFICGYKFVVLFYNGIHRHLDDIYGRNRFLGVEFFAANHVELDT